MLGDDLPEFSMTSPALTGVTRRWTPLQDYSDEVSNARIYGGIHYRFSTLVGTGDGPPARRAREHDDAAAGQGAGRGTLIH